MQLLVDKFSCTVFLIICLKKGKVKRIQEEFQRYLTI